MQQKSRGWVVYHRTIHKMGSFPAVCPHHEWEAMERARPGYHSLVKAGLSSEAEAERLARGSPIEHAIASLSEKTHW
jgi:hypothetical protein